MRDIPAVAVVILNYNGKHFLEQFLPSVVAYSKPYPVIVADNASSDGSIEFLQTNYPEVEIIRFSENLGFCKGYNQALKQVKSSYYLLLNSDVEVTPHWIEPMLRLMERDPLIVACQPKIKSYHQKTHFEYAGAAGGMMDKWGYAFCRGRIFDTIEEDKGQYDQNTEVFWASGACMLVNAIEWHDINGFSEYLFAHYEEIDFCWRWLRQGRKVYYCAESTVYHVGGGTLPKSNPKKTFLNFRNSLVVLYRNTTPTKRPLKIFVRLVLDGVAGLRLLTQGKFADLWAIVRAHWAFYEFLIRYNHVINKGAKEAFAWPMPLLYRKSIVWQYFMKKKKTFKELDW